MCHERCYLRSFRYQLVGENVAELRELVGRVSDLFSVALAQEDGHPVEEVVPVGDVALLQLNRHHLAGKLAKLFQVTFLKVVALTHVVE